jgi:hypothetical protein
MLDDMQLCGRCSGEIRDEDFPGYGMVAEKEEGKKEECESAHGDTPQIGVQDEGIVTVVNEKGEYV